MFIAINLDLASPDSKKDVIKLINEYGIKNTQINLYESFDFPSKKLGTFKRDIIKYVDMDDRLRLYQYPLDDSFKISYLENGVWKRLSIK
ncbi:MAG: hypothetical protein KAT05_14230 [Spirochaetes bacterium]|nr:hypothetical protein [Spirochaetota bacterium]